MSKTGMGSHQSAKMINEEWLTPREIIDSFPLFNLDPCAPFNQPWRTASKKYTKEDNGLIQDWSGSVFLNPPYGRECIKWMRKLSEHGNGIALIFARTETKLFFETVWNKADSILFIEGRLHFHYVNGERAKANSGAPSCLIAYGEACSQWLKESNIKGKFIQL